MPPPSLSIVFFFNDTATTEIYTLSLHDALPIYCASDWRYTAHAPSTPARTLPPRSEEHTSEFQSPDHLVCRLLLEKKKDDSKQTTVDLTTTQIYNNR